MPKVGLKNYWQYQYRFYSSFFSLGGGGEDVYSRELRKSQGLKPHEKAHHKLEMRRKESAEQQTHSKHWAGKDYFKLTVVNKHSVAKCLYSLQCTTGWTGISDETAGDYSRTWEMFSADEIKKESEILSECHFFCDASFVPSAIPMFALSPRGRVSGTCWTGKEWVPEPDNGYSQWNIFAV